VDKWRGQRGNRREGRGRDSEESGGEHEGMRREGKGRDERTCTRLTQVETSTGTDTEQDDS
jgi:hypothetical protein